MSNLLPPFHKVMSSDLECHLANDRVSLLEMALAEKADLADLLEVAYENADFDESLTLDEYKADLREQADARAQDLRARGVEGSRDE